MQPRPQKITRPWTSSHFIYFLSFPHFFVHPFFSKDFKTQTSWKIFCCNFPLPILPKEAKVEGSGDFGENGVFGFVGSVFMGLAGRSRQVTVAHRTSSDTQRGVFSRLCLVAPTLDPLALSAPDNSYRRGIGVREKGVTGRDAIVHKRRRNSSQKATQ